MNSDFGGRRVFTALASLTVIGSGLVLSCSADTTETPYYGSQLVLPAATGGAGGDMTLGAGGDTGVNPPPVPQPGAGGAPGPVPTTPVGPTLPGEGGSGGQGLLPNPPAIDTFDLAAAIKDKTPSVDTDKNGSPDGISVDTNADGMMDAVAVDSDANAVFDKVIRDLDSDGLYEAVVTIPEQKPPEMATACKVEIIAQTENYGGKYGNKNSGAIWISQEDGTFIRTIKVWAKRRIDHVKTWVAASDKDQEGAISSASLGNMELHTVTWDCTDKDGNVLPYGKYKAHVEFTSINGQGPYLPVTFERGAAPAEVTEPAIQGFPMGVTVKYNPAQ